MPTTPPPPAARSGRPASARPDAVWLPRQHGAWFMLALPVAVGWILRLKDDSPLNPQLISIALCWFSGYFAFNAATLLLKRRAGRRGAALMAVLVWTMLASIFGVVAIIFGGPAIAAWALVFAPLAGPALWLAARRKERSVLSGALTVAAAALMTLVSRFGTLSDFLAAVGTPDGTTGMLYTGIVFGYLFGTVLHVKTMIRERGKRSWLVFSVAWHCALTLAVAMAAAVGLLSWAWTILFGVAAARSVALPWLSGRKRVRPLVVGLIEIGLCSGIVLLTALS